MMRYTHKQQAEAMEKAAKKLNLDAHITILQYKKDLHTWADRILARFFRKDMPIKRSYLFCDSLDVDFFFTEDGEAAFTYAGYADHRELEEDKLIKAMCMAKQMREEMQKNIEGGSRNGIERR